MANINPEDTPFLLNEEGGPIDRQLLRDKFTGRSQLFFNNQNYGNRRGSRANDGWNLPELELDPAVKYRAFDGQKWADEILSGYATGGWETLKHAPKGVFFNPGVPLWSYAKPFGGSQQFVFATLGENWGDRNANSPTELNQLSTKWQQGGTLLNPEDRLALSKSYPSFKFKSHGEMFPTEEGKLSLGGQLSELRGRIDQVRVDYDEILRPVREWDEGSDVTGNEVSEKLLKTITARARAMKKSAWLTAADVDDNVYEAQQELEEANEKFKALEGVQGYQSSLDRHDLRKQMWALERSINERKIGVIRKFAEQGAVDDIKAILTPETKEALIKHVSWLEEAMARVNEGRDGTNPQLNQILKLASEAFVSGKATSNGAGLEFVDELTKLDGYFRQLLEETGVYPGAFAGNGTQRLNASYADLLRQALDKNLSTYSQQDLIVGITNLVRTVRGNAPLAKNATEAYDSYEVRPTPGTLPMSGSDTFALLHERETPFGNYFFDEKGRPFLLGPHGAIINASPADDPFFLNPENILKNLTLFPQQGVVSDGRKITLGQLEWPMIGKEGAMYSEQLPIARFQSNWDSIVEPAGWDVEPHPTFRPIGDPSVTIDGSIEGQALSISLDGYNGQAENSNPDVGTKEVIEFKPGGNKFDAVRLKDGSLVLRTSIDYSDFESSFPELGKASKKAKELGINPEWFLLKKREGVTGSKTFQFHAAAISPGQTLRPAVLFRFDPNAPGGISVVREWNNDITKWGFKPIPTGQPNPDALRQSYIRFANEVLEPIRAINIQSIEAEERSIDPMASDEVIRERAEQMRQKVLKSMDDAGVKDYTTPEAFADASLKNGFPQGVWKLLYPTGNRTDNWQSRSVTPGYTQLQNIVDEATRSNPNYGKLGSNFGPQLERLYDTGVMMEQGMNRNMKGFANAYASNPNFRAGVHNATIDAAGRYGPGLLMSTMAGVHVGSKMSEGMPFYQAAPASAAEMGLGYLAFKYFDRYLGGVTTMGDATIEGAKRRMAEEDAIRAERQPEIARSVINAMSNPIGKQKVDWSLVEKTEAARVDKVETKKREEAHQQWLDKNDIFAKDVI
jgi:hypothetical protein